MNYLIDNSDYGSNTSKKASDSENTDNADSGVVNYNGAETLRTEMEVI